MDLIKIGKFIQQRRKAKKLTQVQLAQKIGVSEKTVSKWECGNGFPDASVLLVLCKALDITANELLSAKLLSGDVEYKEQAEKNLAILKQSQQTNAKFLLTLEWILGSCAVMLILLSVLFAALANLHVALRVVVCVISFVLGLVAVHFCLLIEKDAGFYECECCHHKYVPTYKQVFLSTHIGRTRRMKCPNCNKKSWHKKTIEQD